MTREKWGENAGCVSKRGVDDGILSSQRKRIIMIVIVIAYSVSQSNVFHPDLIDRAPLSLLGRPAGGLYSPVDYVLDY